MKLFLLSTAIFLTCVSTVTAQNGHPCDPYAPYYHKIQTGPGAMLADLFFFVGSIPHTVVLVGGARRNVASPHGEQARVSTAACMPITTARHFGQTRSPHAEHWTPD